MTDARFPERLLSDRRLLVLSPVDFQSHVMAVIWAVANRTDGCLHEQELSLIPRFGKNSAPNLVKVGLWERLGAGYLIVDFAAQQTSKDELEVLENARKRDREKKARQRAAKSVPGDNSSSPHFIESESPGTNAGTAQAGRTGRDIDDSRETTGQVVQWATAVPGEPGRLAS